MDEQLPSPIVFDEDTADSDCLTELSMSPDGSRTICLQPPSTTTKRVEAPLAKILSAIEEVLPQFSQFLVLDFLGLSSQHFVNSHKCYMQTSGDRDLQTHMYLSRMTDLLDKKEHVPSCSPSMRKGYHRSVVTLTEEGAVRLNSAKMDFSGFWTLQSMSNQSSWDVCLYVDDARWTFSLPFATVFTERLSGSLPPLSLSEGLPSLTLSF